MGCRSTARVIWPRSRPARRADGFSAPYVAAVAYGSAIYGFLAVLLSLGIARRLVGHGLAASLAIWIGTPLLFYMYVAPPMSHACSAFAVSLFLWTWLHVRERWTIGGAVVLGPHGRADGDGARAGRLSSSRRRRSISSGMAARRRLVCS